MLTATEEASSRSPGVFGYGQPAGGGPPGGGYGPPPGGGYGPPPGGGYGPPPGGGYGPPAGGGYGPPQPGYSPPPSQGSSVSAIFSVIFGVLSWLVCCCPSAPISVPGLILGLVGMSATSSGQKSGRGLAITGTVLNALAAVISIAVISLGGVGYYQSTVEGGRQAEALILRLQKGEADAVYKEAGLAFRNRYQPEALQAIQTDLQGLPAPTSVGVDWEKWQDFDISSKTDMNGSTRILRINYLATFGSAERRGVIEVKQVDKGGWVLQDFTLN